MQPTLLVGSPRHSWRDWLRTHGLGRDILCLDPDEPDLGFPGRLAIYRDGKPIFTRFFGSLDPQRSPHVLIAALAEALPQLREGALVLTFKFRATPILRQTLLLISQLVGPERILVPEGLELSRHGFPVGPEDVELPAAFPAIVHHAQRKAQWLRLKESGELHRVFLRDLPTEGSRWGAGIPMKADLLPGALYLEAVGTTLLAVCPDEPDPSLLARTLDIAGCTRAQVASPEDYHGILCAFCRDSGEEFGFGFIREIDWEGQVAEIISTAIPPAPVRLLRVGSLRIDDRGRELGEAKPGAI